MLKLRAALCALVCAWAVGAQAASSSASARVIGYTEELVDLTPGDDNVAMDAADGWPAFFANAELISPDGHQIGPPSDEPARYGHAQHLSDAFGAANAAAYTYPRADGFVGGQNGQLAQFSASALAEFPHSIGPYTRIIFGVSFELLAAGERASARLDATFMGQTQSMLVDQSGSDGGVHTLQFVFDNNTDGFLPYDRTTIALVVTGSVGSTPPVPEPSQWAMLLAGLALLVSLGRAARHR